MTKRTLCLALLGLAACRNFDDAFTDCQRAGGCREGGAGGATEPGNPVLDFTVPGPIAVGSWPADLEQRRMLGLRNTGTGTTGPVTLTLIAGAGFAIDNNACDQARISEVACSFELVFRPAGRTGDFTAQLTATADAGGTAMRDVTATATGAQLTIAPLPLDLRATLGFPVQQQVTITNVGSVVAGVPVLDAGSGEFSVTACTPAAPLAAQSGSCTATVTFAATTLGPSTGVLSVNAGNASVAAPLIGTALAQGAIRLNPAMVAFGDVDTGATAQRSIDVRNVGPTTTTPLRLTGMLAGALSTSFTGCDGVTLAPDAGCTFTVSFAPAGFTPYAGSVIVEADAGGAAPLMLTGRGIDEVPLTLMFGGNGAGTVTGVYLDGGQRDGGAGFGCTTTCSPLLRRLTVASLTATPFASSSFTGWSGPDCSGDGGCAVVLDLPRSAVATFTLNRYALTVNRAGSGSGRVVSSPAGIDCPGSCAAQFDHGAVVKLHALPFRSALTSFTGCTSSGPTTCTVTMTGVSAATATFEPVNLAFVTRNQLRMVSGSTAAHDVACTEVARDAGLGLGPNNPGQWRAWLSDTGASALSRVGPLNGWMTTAGRLITTGSPVSYPLKNPVSADERGLRIAAQPATGTGAGGALFAGSNCSDWTSSGGLFRVGSTDGVNGGWTDRGQSSPCMPAAGVFEVANLYCFERNRTQAPNARVEPPPGAKYAFVSTGAYLGDVPNAQMNVACTNEAADAGLSGSFRVFRSTTGSPAISAIDGGVFYRVDGQQLSASRAELSSGILVTPINLDARGAAPSGTWGVNPAVWTGSDSPGAVSMPFISYGSCDDWTASGQQGRIGVAGDFVGSQLWSATSTSCTERHHVYCFQE